MRTHEREFPHSCKVLTARGFTKSAKNYNKKTDIETMDSVLVKLDFARTPLKSLNKL